MPHKREPEVGGDASSPLSEAGQSPPCRPPRQAALLYPCTAFSSRVSASVGEELSCVSSALQLDLSELPAQSLAPPRPRAPGGGARPGSALSPGLVWGSALGSLEMKLPGKVTSTQRRDHGMPAAPLHKLTFPVRPEPHLLSVGCAPGPHRS